MRDSHRLFFLLLFVSLAQNVSSQNATLSLVMDYLLSGLYCSDSYNLALNESEIGALNYEMEPILQLIKTENPQDSEKLSEFIERRDFLSVNVGNGNICQAVCPCGTYTSMNSNTSFSCDSSIVGNFWQELELYRTLANCGNTHMGEVFWSPYAPGTLAAYSMVCLRRMLNLPVRLASLSSSNKEMYF